MKEYAVKITETLEKVVCVQAHNREEAEEIAEENWNNSEYILDAENFVCARFEAKESEE